MMRPALSCAGGSNFVHLNGALREMNPKSARCHRRPRPFFHPAAFSFVGASIVTAFIVTPALADDARTDEQLKSAFIEQAEICRGAGGAVAWRACFEKQVVTFILVDRGYCMELDASWVKGGHHEDDWSCVWRTE